MFNLTKDEYQICKLFSEMKINSTELSQAQHTKQFKTLKNMPKRKLM